MLWLALYVASNRDKPRDPRPLGDVEYAVLCGVGILTILAMAAFAIFMLVSDPPDPPTGNDVWL